MATTTLDYAKLFAKNLPAPTPQWNGFPTYNFIGGHNNPDEIPIEDLVASSARALRQEGRELATYNMNSGPLGYTGLREFMVEKMAHYRGIQASPENVLITSGSNQGIDLLNEVLLEPGDTVIAELFTYQGWVNRLRKLQVNLVGIPLDEGGMRMDALASALENLRQKGVTPKYIYTIPTVQNPTGTIMGMERRREMLRLSQEYGVPIFEDECYSDLIWEGDWPPAIRSLDHGNHVLHVGSFSKSLSPSMRLAYFVGPWEVLSRMLACKVDGGTGALGQIIVADFFQNHYEEHMERLRASLRHKLEATVAALRTHFGTTVEFQVPRGGIFIWVKFPEQIDTRQLVAPALKEGIAFNEGPAWTTDPESARNYLRLCFALPSDQHIDEGIAKLAQVFHREVGIP
ncbi:MAG: PLP-dependent aminotransferase family protein [Candidatus Tectomicrobia bacterium]|uniref:PLP-dependent aminotransferase family protein n=1 Tax=Tectimicrobiota bacterium TaxID=2528274 RepID=A0A938B4W0_UNCTE|nr:PLP-dependent aminotransferase family protein [Candidatus Tectomicrobia bacterium]